MLDALIYVALGIVIGCAVGWVACLRWHGWRFWRRDAELKMREADLCEREQNVTAAEQDARKAADRLRPYTAKSSNR